MAYIAQAAGRKGKRSKREPCLFCSLKGRKPGPRNLVLASTPGVLVMLNLYPYNVAHVMVAPRKHRGSLADLTPEEAVELTDWLGRVETALKRSYRPHGFNLGMNLGRTAGAGVLGHLHWHVVPRWNGDTNFMPVTGGTKVLPEALDRTYRRVSEALASGRTKPAARSPRR
jgi:ATP adenylyltransferase